MKTFFVVVSLTLFLTACGQSDEPAAVAAPAVTRRGVRGADGQSSCGRW